MQKMQNILSTLLAGLCMLSAIGLTVNAYAQEASDIFIGNLHRTQNGIQVDALLPVTNTPDYSNQPYFFDDSTLYFTQAINGQMDILKYQIDIGTTQNVTNSSDSEYSPTPTIDGMGLSVIKVNSQGEQELWMLDFSGQPQTHLSPSIEPVGYHAWTTDEKVVLFVLGEPHTLRYADPFNRQDEGAILATNIGASIYPVPKTTLISYSVTQVDKGDRLFSFNPDNGEQRFLVELPLNAAYYAWTPRTELLTVKSGKLMVMPFMVTPEGLVHTAYSQVNIQSPHCQHGITRIAVSPFSERIALVCNRP